MSLKKKKMEDIANQLHCPSHSHVAFFFQWRAWEGGVACEFSLWMVVTRKQKKKKAAVQAVCPRAFILEGLQTANAFERDVAQQRHLV